MRTAGPSWTYDRKTRQRRWQQNLLHRVWLRLTYRLFWKPLRDLMAEEMAVAILDHEHYEHPHR